MIKSTNTLGSLEAALAMTSYNLYIALTKNEVKESNRCMDMIQRIISQIKNVRALIKEQEAA